MSERRLDPLQIVQASYVGSVGVSLSAGREEAASGHAHLPPPTGAEIAFAGRSNVGKSSLINALVERRGLVRTSSTPGSTRQINVFEARARDGVTFRLVDLPGYGFTRRSKAEQTLWAAMIEGYLRERVTLAAVVLLVDARRGILQDDLELIHFIQSSRGAQRRPVQLILVATKIDKLPSSQRKSLLSRLGRAAVEPLPRGSQPSVPPPPPSRRGTQFAGGAAEGPPSRRGRQIPAGAVEGPPTRKGGPPPGGAVEGPPTRKGGPPPGGAVEGPPSRRGRQIPEASGEAALKSPQSILGFSSLTGEGRRELWIAIRRAAFGTDSTAPPAPSTQTPPEAEAKPGPEADAEPGPEADAEPGADAGPESEPET